MQRGLCSQYRCLLENPLLQIAVDGFVSQHIGFAPEHLLDFLLQADQVIQAAVFFHADQQINVAGIGILSSGCRAEHTHVFSPVPGSSGKNVSPSIAEQF